MVQFLGDSGNKIFSLNGSLLKEKDPIPTTLGSRIDNKATVVGVLQDHEGNDYVLAVVDAAYRSSSAMAWSSEQVDTPLQNDVTQANALADHHSGKYNTDLILSTYTATDYPAFNFARNACSVTFNGVTYYSVLPNYNEIKYLFNNKDVLDQYDPTVEDYNSRSMSEFKCGGTYGLWSSTEWGPSTAWCDKDVYFMKDNNNMCGVCPVICIPLS